MLSKIIIFICLLIYTPGNSQHLYRGKLISGLTGKPVKSGYIECNGKLLADTDTTGSFTIALDSTINIPLLFYSTTTGWVAMDSLNFHKDSTVIILLKPECPYNAEKDIREKRPKLFIASGPFNSPPPESDKKFEKKYTIDYYGTGDCTTVTATDCLAIYNQTVFMYLDKKYGKKWRKEVNQNVYGL